MCCPDTAINESPQLLAFLCLLLNIFMPGLGTMINACYGDFKGAGLFYGLMQFLFAILIVPWIWSIVYGVKIV